MGMPELRGTPELRVFSTLGVAGVLDGFVPSYAAARVVLTLAPTQLLVQRIRAGERADLAILVDESVDALVAEGVLLPGRTDLARSLVGVAVRAGAPRPDISTKEAFVASMLAAGSLALSRAGASGLFFAGLLERLGIADAVNAKATVIASGFTGELVARGEAEVAVQQISELMVVPGLDIVGPLPPGIEGVSVFSAAVFAGTEEAEAAAAFVAALGDAGLGAVYRAKGLEPLSRSR